MKSNGSLYVSVVLVALVGYFSYQWWFNPQRAVKRQLGELAAVLSTPADNQGGPDRVARAARLRRYFAVDASIHLGPSGPELVSRDAIVAAFAAWTPPPGGLNVDFVDVQVRLVSPSGARAFMTVEITGRDRETGELARDARDVRVGMTALDGNWVVTSAEPGAVPSPP